MPESVSQIPSHSDWLPPEVTADLAKFPDDAKFFKVKAGDGGVLLQVPSREAFLERYPAPLGVRGVLRTEDGDLGKDVDLVLASVLYPDNQTVRGYFAKAPHIAPYLATLAKNAAFGIKGDGLTTNVTAQQALDFKQLDLVGAGPYHVVTDLLAPQDGLVMRVPDADTFKQCAAARRQESAIVACETLVLACLLRPAAPIVQEMFRRRPLLSVHCANGLNYLSADRRGRTAMLTTIQGDLVVVATNMPTRNYWEAPFALPEIDPLPAHIWPMGDHVFCAMCGCRSRLPNGNKEDHAGESRGFAMLHEHQPKAPRR